MNPRKLPFWLAGSISATALLTFSSSLFAGVVTWDGPVNGGDLAAPVNWVNDILPGPTDDAYFPTTPTAQGVTLNNANLTIGSLDFMRATGVLTVTNATAATTSILTIGSVGDTNEGPGGPSANDLIYVATGAAINLTGTGTGLGTLQVALGRDGNFNVANTATTSSLNISAAVSGAYGITKTGVGVMNLSNATNSFSGGLTIKSGTVATTSTFTNATSTVFGTGLITIGDSANTGAAATLNLNQSASITYNNNIATTGTGVNTINVANYFASVTGNTSLAADLVLSTTNNANSTLNLGVANTTAITGTGNLITSAGGTNSGTVINVNSAVNMVGNITNNGAGAPATGLKTVNFIGSIGSNVTGITQNSVGSQLSLSGANSFTGGINIMAGTVNARNATALGAGTAGNNVGTITLGDAANTGLAATLNGNGANYTASNLINVVGTGARTLSTTSFSPTYTGAVTLNSTDLNIITNNTGGSDITVSGGITGAGNLVLQSNAATTNNSSSRVVLNGATINNIGSITNSGTGSTTGTGNLNTTISASIGSNVTSLVQNSANSRLIISGANTTFTGNTIVQMGTLQLASTGGFTFAIGANGVNNSISGTGTALLDGKFTFNFASAAANGSWNIVDAANLNETYGGTFAVNGFTKNGTLWTQTVGTSTYTFDQTTGLLTAVPEPTSLALLGLGAIALSARRNRKAI